MSPDDLAAQLTRYDWSLLKSLKGWSVSRDEDIVTFTCRARDGETYFVRLGCASVPHEAPSVAFVNAAGSKMDSKAWPRGRGEFSQIVKPPPHAFLCTALTLEGLQHHPDWRAKTCAWHNRRSLLDIMNLVQSLLDSAEYEGRGG